MAFLEKVADVEAIPSSETKLRIQAFISFHTHYTGVRNDALKYSILSYYSLICLFVYLFASLEHGGQLFRNEKRAAVTRCSLEKGTSGMPTIAYRIIENQRNAGSSNKVRVLKRMFKLTSTTKIITFFLAFDLN